MIEWVNAKMVIWGEAMAGGRRGGGSNSSPFPAYQAVHIRGTAGGADLVHPEAMEIDRVMAKVKQSKPDWYEVAYGFYVEGRSKQSIAERMRCHRDTVYARFDSLHLHVANQITARETVKATANV